MDSIPAASNSQPRKVSLEPRCLQLRNQEVSNMSVTLEPHEWRRPDDADVAPTVAANLDEIRHEKRRPLFPELAKVVG